MNARGRQGDRDDVLKLPYQWRKVRQATLCGPAQGHLKVWWLLTLECGHLKDPWLGASARLPGEVHCYECGRTPSVPSTSALQSEHTGSNSSA